MIGRWRTQAMAGVLVVVAAGAATTAGQSGPPPIGAINSVIVEPAAPSVTVGSQVFFKATGSFAGGTRLLASNGNPPTWHVLFSPTPGIDVSACTNPPQSVTFCCQGVNLSPTGTFHETWTPFTPLLDVSGVLSPATVQASLACAPATGITGPAGTLSATWSGTQYDGTFSFDGGAGTIAVKGLTWESSDPSVAAVDARGVATAIAPGTTTITAIYGSTCWWGEPEPPGGCVGSVAGTATLTVTGNTCPPPTLDRLSVSPEMLWPPNHRMVPVTLETEITNACSRPYHCEIASVTSSEPPNGRGDGHTAQDWQLTGPLALNLRAERSGTGRGRFYTVVVRCSDGAGNTSTKAVVVTVPHNR